MLNILFFNLLFMIDVLLSQQHIFFIHFSSIFYHFFNLIDIYI
nr:MAG TPA: hypothetical protein [Caudoviricetes sp.]